MWRALLFVLLLSSCGNGVEQQRILDREGRIAVVIDLRDGRKDGPVTFYWADGTIRCQGQYRNDHRDGWWRSYHPDGSHRSLSHYSRGQKEGPRIYWDTTGRPMRAEHFVGGVPNGAFYRFFPEGRPAQRSHYVNGLLEGPHDQWYKDRGGSWVNGFYHLGLEAGVWTECDTAGHLIWQARFKDGVIVGPLKGKRRRH